MNLKIFGFEELNFLQIQIKENDEMSFEKLSSNGRYMESAVFSIFKSCFELSKPEFQYYAVNYYSTDQVVALRNHLLTHLIRIQAIQSSDDLQTFILHQISGIELMNELKKQYREWTILWEVIRDKLAAINSEIIEIADQCIDDDKALWVSGY